MPFSGGGGDGAPAVYPIRAEFWTTEAEIIVGAPFAISKVVSQLHAFWAAIKNINTKFQHKSVLLDSGDYTFYVLGIKQVDAGIFKWSLVGPETVVITDSEDWYNTPTVINTIFSHSFSLTTAGVYVLVGEMNGKNALSLDYETATTKQWIIKD